MGSSRAKRPMRSQFSKLGVFRFPFNYVRPRRARCKSNFQNLGVIRHRWNHVACEQHKERPRSAQCDVYLKIRDEVSKQLQCPLRVQGISTLRGPSREAELHPLVLYVLRNKQCITYYVTNCVTYFQNTHLISAFLKSCLGIESIYRCFSYFSMGR